MRTMPLEQTDRNFAEIVENLVPGEEIVLTRGGEPVATIRSTPAVSGLRRLGTLKGSVLSIALNFDEIPTGFEEYLP